MHYKTHFKLTGLNPSGRLFQDKEQLSAACEFSGSVTPQEAPVVGLSVLHPQRADLPTTRLISGQGDGHS